MLVSLHVGWEIVGMSPCPKAVGDESQIPHILQPAMTFSLKGDASTPRSPIVLKGLLKKINLQHHTAPATTSDTRTWSILPSFHHSSLLPLRPFLPTFPAYLLVLLLLILFDAFPSQMGNWVSMFQVLIDSMLYLSHLSSLRLTVFSSPLYYLSLLSLNFFWHTRPILSCLCITDILNLVLPACSIAFTLGLLLVGWPPTCSHAEAGKKSTILSWTPAGGRGSSCPTMTIWGGSGEWNICDISVKKEHVCIHCTPAANTRQNTIETNWNNHKYIDTYYYLTSYLTRLYFTLRCRSYIGSFSTWTSLDDEMWIMHDYCTAAQKYITVACTLPTPVWYGHRPTCFHQNCIRLCLNVQSARRKLLQYIRTKTKRQQQRSKVDTLPQKATSIGIPHSRS